MVLNPETGHISPQFHVAFDDKISTVSLMREVTIPPNWTDITQHSSLSGAMENIELNYTWFNPDIEKYPRVTPSHEPNFATENNNSTLVLSQYIIHVQESTAREGETVSEVHERTASEGV